MPYDGTNESPWNNPKKIMAINYRLKAARVLNGLKQEKLAQLLRIKRQKLSRIENGQSWAGPKLKRRIALLLGKPTFELFMA